ncbi:peptidoglycan endopeptidase [Flavobacterium restrictum]|uniref:LysM peptidoglycan-binding domain-containing protein n=1 Tax=Flavobacterium restrictum TaxID=2594428 RepID=A0A553DU06_9FLAO|nr:peptidoglycan endopeptidase [Flavobacterium restrictum]TRX36241.1 LysM peptidoglycan-binding domain-containing protein [Flavobacterium restrictum]
MKGFKWIVFVWIVTSWTVFSQEKWIKHMIVKGETITSIAQKYKISPKAIYEMNPDAVGTLKLNAVLLIPVLDAKKGSKVVVQESEMVTTLHEVQTKETLYGIAKQYGITVDAIQKANPVLEKCALKIGQKITIIAKPKAAENTIPASKPIPEVPVVLVPEKNPTPKGLPIIEKPEATNVTNDAKTSIHEVLQKETKYGIAKQYGITVADLEHANPELEKKGLEIGQKITIPLKDGFEITASIEKPKEIPVPQISIPEKELPKTATVVTPTKTQITPPTQGQITHEVLPKETKYGIAKQYGITVPELEKQNPNCANRLIVGTQLTIFGSQVPPETSSENTSIEVLDNKKTTTTVAKILPVYSDELVNELIDTATDNMGIRYRSGGTTKAGFDCSGLVWSTFDANHIDLPRSSVEQANFGIKVDMTQAKKGDLIFFKTNGSRQISHVGMIIEVLDDEIKFIHSATSTGVMVSSTKEEYYEKRFVQISRVLQ